MAWMHNVRQAASRRFTLPLYTRPSTFLRMYLATVFRAAQITAGLHDPLTRLAAKYKSDKGITIFPFHGYTKNYHTLFQHVRNTEFNLLEIGLARVEDRRALSITCPSLNMWVDYFPKAYIYGFDIDDFSTVQLPRTRIIRGDQGNPDDLLQVVQTCSTFDVIIDDGSHASYHQQVTMQTLFPSLSSKGLYIIEDLNFQPADIETSMPCTYKTKDLLKDRPALDKMISGVSEVRFFDVPLAGRKEGMVVIRKQ